MPLEIHQDFIYALWKREYITLCWSTNRILMKCNVIDLMRKFLRVNTRVLFHAYTFHAHTSTCVLPRDMYFYTLTSTRCVFPCMYFHEMCTLHDMSKCGPCKHVTGMHCSIVVVPHKITRGKMKLQLSGTVILN